MTLIGQQVRCHKNLHRGDWSITVKGKVVAHLQAVTLRDVTFIVSQATRDKVLQKHCRAVHAWCVGTVTVPLPALPSQFLGDVTFGHFTEVTYNPYRAGTFTTRDGTPVQHADYMLFAADGKAYGAGLR